MTGKRLKRNCFYCFKLPSETFSGPACSACYVSVTGQGVGVIGVNIIERAYQLAMESGSVEEVKRKLMREGYLNVHSHLSGHQIRHDLLKRLNPQLVTYRKARAG